MVILGKAVHPLPAGSLQGEAMAVEDATDLQEDHCASVVYTKQCNLYFQMMPAGPQQEQCNQEMHAKTAQGLKELWGYDTEDDEADNWWVKWGLLHKQAKQ
ncbi:hypothetical protein BDR04DRAFT_1164219 [Suillus decipiens]|nr:hypothetical protein BDR04DRAFT_1164219 [Suillus decipiens]